MGKRKRQTHVYRIVEQRLWGDARFLALSRPREPSAQVIWLFLVAGPWTTAVPGIVLATPATIADYWGWDLDATRAVVAELTGSQAHSTVGPDVAPVKHLGRTWVGPDPVVHPDALAWHVEGCGYFALPGAWKPDPKSVHKPYNPQVINKWEWVWQRIPESPLKVLTWEHLRDFCASFGQGYERTFINTCRRPNLDIGKPRKWVRDPDVGPDVAPVKHLSRTCVPPEQGTMNSEQGKERPGSEAPGRHPPAPPEAEALAQVLADSILARQPDYRELQEDKKARTLARWANDFRLMRERDRRPWSKMRELLVWARADSFWSANILSAAKFRKQYDTLVAQRGRVNGHANPGMSPARRAAERAKEMARREREQETLDANAKEGSL